MMGISKLPLVLTKLSVPVARGRVIPRDHLIDLLNSKKNGNIILVCAPAGYGKTTVLSEWANSLMKNGTTVFWYALDSSDNDPIPFRAYLIASLIHSLDSMPELNHLTQLLRSAPEMDMQYVLNTAINAILNSKKDCVLFLDDYHLISSPVIHSALAYLCDHQPENLRIVIGSRSDPPLPLARLRVRGRLLEIRTANLRFKEGETRRFLNELMQLGLSPEGIALLEERTEGWIAGLQLASLSLSSRVDKEQVVSSFSGNHRYLVEYLMEEVFQRQTQEVQDFLLSTAILERLCAPLCDQILMIANEEQGTKDSISPTLSSPSLGILEYLEKSNLFLLALDEGKTWYRYHILFRDFLITRLGKSRPELIADLHRVSCDWLAEHGFLREAASHVFQTHDWEKAAAFVERHSFTLITLGDISTIYEWCSAFPEEVMQKHPMLCLQQALSLAYNSLLKNVPRVETRLKQVSQTLIALKDQQPAQELRDFSGIVRTFLAFVPNLSVDPDELLVLARDILDAYPQGDPGQFSGLLLTGYAYMALQDAQSANHAFETARQIALRERLFFGIVESSFHLARLAQSQGQLRRSIEICLQASADIQVILPNPEQELPALGSLEIVLGCALLEQDHLNEAEKHLRHGLELMGAGMNTIYLLTAYVACFRLCEIQNHSAEALEFLDDLKAVWPDVSFCTEGLRILHFLRFAPQQSSTRTKIENWSQSISRLFNDEMVLPGLGPFGAADAYYLASIAWVEAQIVLGRPTAALPYLDKQLSLAANNNLIQREIELSLLKTMACDAAGDLGQARVTLERALNLAQPEGYLRIFDQNPLLTQLLVKMAQQGVSGEYISRILAILSKQEARAADRIAQVLYGESLSERESEVLQLIAQGATNQQIAEQLVVTVGTVKSHINHILRKLDAHNRTEAVARARGLGLLEI